MDTYSNEHNRRTNHGLAAFHAFASWGVVLPATTGGWAAVIFSSHALAARGWLCWVA